MSLSPDRVLSASLIRLRGCVPFLSTLALLMRIEPGIYTPTLATNGRDILGNPEYLTSRSSAVVDATLMHVVLHAALLHLPRRGNRDPLLWNAAADIVVNGIVEGIAREKGNRYDGTPSFTLFPDAIRDPALQSGTVEEVYDALVASGKLVEVPYNLCDLRDTPEVAPALLIAYWKAAWEAAREFEAANPHHVMPAQLTRELVQVEGVIAGGGTWDTYDSQEAIEAILSGQGERVTLPAEPLSRFVLITNLAKRAGNGESVWQVFTWLTESARPEHVQFFAVDLFRKLRAAEKMSETMAMLTKQMQRSSVFLKFMEDYTEMMSA